MGEEFKFFWWLLGIAAILFCMVFPHGNDYVDPDYVPLLGALNIVGHSVFWCCWSVLWLEWLHQAAYPDLYKSNKGS